MEALLQEIEVFFLIFVRIFTLVSVLPIFNHRAIPITLRVALSIIFSITLFHQIQTTLPDTLNPVAFLALVAREILTGIVLGFTAEFIFYAIRFAGQVIGFMMGFSMVMAYDPQSAQQVSIIAQLKMIVAITLFLIIDGHLLFLEAMAKSFQIVPLVGASFPGTIAGSVLRLSADVLVMALQMTAPILVTIFLTNVALGILARTVPQMNVFIVGFPLTIGVGFIALIMTFPFFGHYFTDLLPYVRENMVRLMQTMGA